MTFNEANTVEAFIRDRLAGETGPTIVSPGVARQGAELFGLGWHFVGPAELPRQSQEVVVECYLREALIRLNPDVAASPSRVDDVLYRATCKIPPLSGIWPPYEADCPGSRGRSLILSGFSPPGQEERPHVTTTNTIWILALHSRRFVSVA